MSPRGQFCILLGAFAMLTASEALAGARVRLGVDTLITRGFEPIKGRRVGLITNPTGVTGDLRSTVDVLHAAPAVKLVALFAPEHGVRGDAYAGDKVTDATDERTGVPVYSLYGKSRRPTPQMLAGIDVLVFDIQDIGSRSYTFISTMAAAMEGAAEQGIEFIVLDRPNPLNGLRVEGRPLDPAYKSFVGYLPITYVHGMTVGELARMINGEGWLPNGARCRLTVVPMSGWTREMDFEDTGLSWVPSSPHVPHADTSLFYAATGIMGELRTLSEGVGYPLPFEVAGAPGIDAYALADKLQRRGLPGVIFRPIYYRPYYASHKGEMCGGVQVHLTDRAAAHLTGIQFHIMDCVRELEPKTEFFGSRRDKMFDKVCGTDRIRELFEDGAPIGRIMEVWGEGVGEFRRQRAKYLLY